MMTTMKQLLVSKAAFTRQTKVGKLVLENFKKLANSCLHASNSHQITTHAKFSTWTTYCKDTHVELPLVSVGLAYFTLIAGEETESAGKIERFRRKSVSAEIPPLERTVTDVLCLHVFCAFVCWRRNVPQIGTIVNFLDESKRCLTFVKSLRHFGKCHANHVNRARVIG